MSQIEWETTEIRASRVGHVSPFSCPGLDQRRGAVLVDSLANQESVKLYGNAFGEAARFDEILAATEKEAVTSQALGGLLNLGQALIFGAGLWAALSLAVAKHALDPAAFSVGDVVAVNALLLQLAVPMNFLGYTVSEIRQGLVDADAVVTAAREADAEPAPPPPRHSAAPPAVAFRDVWVFRGGTTALRGASFEAVPGGVTALVGASGSGKSTALRILAGLEGPPDGGAVAADPKGLTTMVAQDGVLFDDTVAYNVRYGRPGASDADVSEALSAVSLGDLDGASPVGERGAKLSGGERQRVLAARALLRPSNLLLLDESTSALDAPTEAAVLSALLDAKGRPRTALVVAHRLQAITPRADSVVVFDGGRVVAQGSHPDLLATCPEYQALWRADDDDAAAAHAP